MRVVRLLMITVVPLALALGGAWLYVWHWYAAPGPLTAEKTVLIAPGLGFRGIARVLAQEGVIGQPLLYRFCRDFYLRRFAVCFSSLSNTVS